MVASPSLVAFLAGCSGRQPLGVRCVRENKVVEPLRGMVTSQASICVADKVAAFAARWRGEAEMGANGDRSWSCVGARRRGCRIVEEEGLIFN